MFWSKNKNSKELFLARDAFKMSEDAKEAKRQREMDAIVKRMKEVIEYGGTIITTRIDCLENIILLESSGYKLQRYIIDSSKHYDVFNNDYNYKVDPDNGRSPGKYSISWNKKDVC